MILRRLFPALMLAVLGVLVTGTAHAAPPSAANSFVDPCLRVCPAGDMIFHVVVRDLSNNPVAGSSVLIDGICGGTPVDTFVVCPPLPTDPYTFVPPSSFLMVTNAAGVADFPIRAGGVCVDGGGINIIADGVLLAILHAVVSPDQNGDLMVDAVDNGIVTTQLGTSNPTADLNCSGLVDIGDPNALLAHLGHTCQGVVPNQPKSWGSVKVIYR